MIVIGEKKLIIKIGRPLKNVEDRKNLESVINKANETDVAGLLYGPTSTYYDHEEMNSSFARSAYCRIVFKALNEMQYNHNFKTGKGKLRYYKGNEEFEISADYKNEGLRKISEAFEGDLSTSKLGQGICFTGEIPEDRYEEASKSWAEGRKTLESLIMTCLKNKIKTSASCAGHEGSLAYIKLVNEDVFTKAIIIELEKYYGIQIRYDGQFVVNYVDADIEFEKINKCIQEIVNEKYVDCKTEQEREEIAIDVIVNAKINELLELGIDLEKISKMKNNIYADISDDIFIKIQEEASRRLLQQDHHVDNQVKNVIKSHCITPEEVSKSAQMIRGIVELEHENGHEDSLDVKG